MLTLNDGRSELWQWDTGRTLAVDADCSQVHFSNKVFGRSIDVDVVDGAAIIPDVLLQTDKDLNVWAFVGTAENGYTKISKTFKINRRNKPADYVFTPPDQTSLEEIKERLEYIEQNPAEVPVKSVNGKTGTVELTAEDVGAISLGDLQEATNEALAQAKASGAFDGEDGKSAYAYAVEGGYTGTEEEFAAKLAAEIASGLSETAKALLITILRNGVYIIDQSANITALENALASGGSGDSGGGDTETVTYTITNNLTNCSNSNTAATIAENSAYTAVITAVEGYELDSVVVTMGGVAVSVTDGVISIASVTGNIVITATAVEASTSNLINFNGGTIITNGTGTATILDDHSAIVAGGYATVIVNRLSPGSQYSFNFDGGASFSIFGSKNDNITAEPESANMVRIRQNGTADASELPYMFTLPNTCRALLIFIYEGTWSNMVLEKQVNPLEGSPYEFTFIENEYIDNSTGEIKSYTGWTRTDFTPCFGVSAIRTYQSGNGQDSKYNAFYDENKNFISGGFYVIGGSPISVPDNAHYFILSGETALMHTLTVIPIAKEA